MASAGVLKKLQQQTKVVSLGTATATTTATQHLASAPKLRVVQAKLGTSSGGGGAGAGAGAGAATSTSSSSGSKQLRVVPMPQKTPKARQAETASKKGNLRDTVRKTFFEQLITRLKQAEDELKLSEDEVCIF